MPNQRMLHVNGVEIAAFEWGEAKQPAVLFVHATGFHARIWDQVIALLPEYHCIAIDLRGHGRSSKPAPPFDWRYFAKDVAAVGAAFGLSGATAVGHSVGGHAVTLAAINPELFSQLLLIDPVIMPSEAYVGVQDFAHFTARRRAEWSSADEMYERFKDRPPFNAWKPQILRDYVDYGLLPKPDGTGYVLACEPAYEAATYNYSTATDPYSAVAKVQIPVTILRAGGALDTSAFDMSASPTAPDLAAKFEQGTDVPLPQYSHFIPMEAPETVAEYVRKMTTGS